MVATKKEVPTSKLCCVPVVLLVTRIPYANPEPVSERAVPLRMANWEWGLAAKTTRIVIREDAMQVETADRTHVYVLLYETLARFVTKTRKFFLFEWSKHPFRHRYRRQPQCSETLFLAFFLYFTINIPTETVSPTIALEKSTCPF